MAEELLARVGDTKVFLDFQGTPIRIDLLRWDAAILTDINPETGVEYTQAEIDNEWIVNEFVGKLRGWRIENGPNSEDGVYTLRLWTGEDKGDGQRYQERDLKQAIGRPGDSQLIVPPVDIDNRDESTEWHFALSWSRKKGR